MKYLNSYFTLKAAARRTTTANLQALHEKKTISSVKEKKFNFFKFMSKSENVLVN